MLGCQSPSDQLVNTVIIKLQFLYLCFLILFSYKCSLYCSVNNIFFFTDSFYFYHHSSGIDVNSSENALLSNPAGPRIYYRHKEKAPGVHTCNDCGKEYRWRKNLMSHKRFECGKEPQFQCPYCPHRSARKGNLKIHINKLHPS